MTRNKRMNRAIWNEKEEIDEDRISSLPDSLLLHILSFLSTKHYVRTCVLSKRWQFVWTHLLDRISSLPGFLLIHILSFLSTKDTVKTCVLSKRWQFVWTDLSKINLRELDYNEEELFSFVDYVGRMIAMCRSLNKFSVEIDYHSGFASNVNHWVNFAIKNKVKYISLRFNYSPGSYYKLPQMLFSYSSLSKLRITECVMAPRGIIAWDSLESLKIERVELLDYVMENILSNCPILKILDISNCRGLNYLNIKSPNLTTLRYWDGQGCDTRVPDIFWHGEGYDIPDISAPYLRELSISGNAEGRHVSSFVQASLMNHMKHLLESLQYSVEKLELGPHLLQTVWMLDVKSWKLPSNTKLWSLTLNAFNHKISIPGILAILRSSPNLRTLLIEVRNPNDKEKAKLDQYGICLKDCNMDLVASHLKTVEIDKFTHTEHMLSLVQVLLRSTNVLEKMVINLDAPSSSASIDSMEIADRLRTFPRASPKAVLELRYY